MAQSSRLQLSLSAQKVANLAGILQTSDPFCVVTVRGDSPDNRPIIVGQTEVVYNNLSPSWSTVVFLEGFKFGVPFFIEVGVFDFSARKVGKSERELSKQSSEENARIIATESTRGLLRTGSFPHKVMGTALFEVGEVLGARGNVASKSLQTGGAVYAHIERSRSEGHEGTIRLQLSGFNLQNTQRLAGKCSPFFELFRKVELSVGSTWHTVYRSNVVRSDLNPLWNEVMLSLETVCNGDMDRAMKVTVYDHRRSGKHKLMGEFETSMMRILDSKTNTGEWDDQLGFELRRNDKKVGQIRVLKADIMYSQTSESPSVGRSASNGIPPHVTVSNRPEFVDYLTGGCEISLAVAIDFTASNGDPRQEGTPHYFHPPSSSEWNDYEKAIFAVGSILAKFDSDQRFPVWGFGARYDDVVRHCFQCGNETEVEGVQGIMDAYRGVFRTPLALSSPTLFTHVIGTAASYANHEQDEAKQRGLLSYTILLILTAGNDENVAETKRELIQASEAPMSVVIVGIGNADFSGMEFLDEHDSATEGGRDITKFVRFSDYNSYNALTAAVLDEIPDQLVDYYFERGILPGQAEELDMENVTVMSADDDDRTINFLG